MHQHHRDSVRLFRAPAKLNGVFVYILYYYKTVFGEHYPSRITEHCSSKGSERKHPQRRTAMGKSVSSRFQVKWKSQFTEIENLIFNRQRCGNSNVSYDYDLAASLCAPAISRQRIYGWTNCRMEIDLASTTYIFSFFGKTTNILSAVF